MTGTFSPEERARITAALRAGTEPACPACGARLSVRDIEARPDVPYVRRRVLVICPACRRSASLDRPPPR